MPKKSKLEKGTIGRQKKPTKHKTKLTRLGKRKSKAQIAKRIQAATESEYRHLYPELRLKEKAANERMRQLEKAGINSPAYQAVQAQLEILGKQTKDNRGRRFSETGKATYNEMEILNRILDAFLNQQTSTLKGAKQYEKDVWETANKNNKLADAGISRNDWLNFWASMPDKKNRMFGSSQYVAMIRAYSIKNGNLDDDNKLSVQEIADEIASQKTLKKAYDALGLTYDEVRAAKIKKPLGRRFIRGKNYD